MKQSVDQRLNALRGLSKPALCKLWEELFAASPPAKLRADLMIPILAYRIQEQAFGALRATTRTRLRTLSVAFEKDAGSAIAFPPTLQPGTRLVRQWRDQVHLVNVEANRYEYRGARYQSLSEIARLITGTRWSGPLFFGIKNKPTCSQAEESR
jgi:Protein of unknown function (DUF2924)